MTDLNKPVSCRSIVPHRGRRIVVTLAPGDVIGFRPERTRRTCRARIETPDSPQPPRSLSVVFGCRLA